MHLHKALRRGDWRQKLVQLAAANNAHWCNLVCRTNGSPGTFGFSAWYAAGHVPMFYPNIVTLQTGCGLQTIHRLNRHMQGSISVKDSYNTLDLKRLDFDKLFEGQWFVMAETRHKPVRCRTISSGAELQQWECAWNNGLPAGIFRRAVHSYPAVRFIAFYKDGEIVAGCVLSKSHGVVGVTNFFCPPQTPAPYWAGCLAAAQRFAPDQPVVGYVAGTFPDWLHTEGAIELGKLSVWTKRIA